MFTKAGTHNLHLALAELPLEFYDLDDRKVEKDKPTITCLRSVLMKPDHLEWIDRIWHILDRVTGAVLRSGQDQGGSPFP